ncbi:putative integral inner nuclear membrane protein ima1 protein [Eutypa lata UCREL1]|uniref:Putative integral inner nuclear membrane protein ima1 protein n=1 Tax=Eutypa lata (strain UCR-EL1) TaxID=1287681 RepID=M7S5R7_EUTLA|nr:putative integral inner nuclear membrane protein ima1 protein [Eutypa lata UCREL1]
MAPLRSRKRLACFYCGKRSNLQFEGQKSFDCRYCDATNWLDEHGNITDVPSSNLEREPAPVQYAIPRASTRSPSPTLLLDGAAAIFCDKCLRNQHLVTSVLAQYEWPDEPTGPEASAAERKFWALRKDMERRYPQMCADCEPKVEKGLREASYTARTDHLRRMMDRTRTQRQEVKQRGILDLVDMTGRWIWHMGYILQFWWHAAVLLSIFDQYYSSADLNSWTSLVLRTASRVGAHKLPHGDGQVDQFASDDHGWGPTRLVSFDDLRFKPNTPQKVDKIDKEPVLRKDPNDLGGILDDILQSPSAPPSEPTSSPTQFRHQNGTRASHQPSGSFYNGYVQRNGPNSSFGALDLSDPPIPKPAEPQVQYDEEMDWSPSASQHRAFSTYNPYKVKNTNPRFSDTPIEPKPGPIWYKVPPAPTTPAQRLRNPPMKPIIRESPKETKENFFQQNNNNARGRRVEIGSPATPGRPSAAAAPDTTIFANPKFYAPEPQDDPRDGLTHMFASSFSISPSPEQQEGQRKAMAARKIGGGVSSFFARLGNSSGNNNNTSKPSPSPQRNRSVDRAVELVVLLAALAAWIRALDSAW